MEKTTKTRVSNFKPFIGEPSPGDQRPGIKPSIHFYGVEENDNYDSGEKAIIHVKIDIFSTATKQNTKNLNFPVIKYSCFQGPKVIRVLREMMVGIFEHLGVTTWKSIYHRWICFEKVLKGPALKKIRKDVLTCKKISRDEAEDQWDLGKPENLCS